MEAVKAGSRDPAERGPVLPSRQSVDLRVDGVPRCAHQGWCDVKILISAYQCVPNEGSELGNAWNWARALADLGHRVTVVTHGNQEGRGALAPDIELVFVPVDDVAPQRRVRPLGGFGEQVYWLWDYLRFQDAAAQHLISHGRTDFDVIHHVSWGSLHLGSQLWRLGPPLVYGPIGGGQVAPGAYRRYFGRQWPVELVRTMATAPLTLRANPRSRETVRHAAMVLTTNSDTGRACRALGGRDVRDMLAEGLPVSWVGEPRERPDGIPTVLWVGRFLPRKAPTLAVQAFAELRRRTPARMLMAGDGPLLHETRSLVGKLGLADDVELLGRVPWNDITRLYDSATVFLFSSLRDSSGSQFLEAMGRGLPAVALNHHGVGETDVGRAAEKVDLPTDPALLPRLVGEALHEVVTDDRWADRSAAAVAWAAQHTWPAKAATATRLYADLPPQRPRAARSRGEAS